MQSTPQLDDLSREQLVALLADVLARLIAPTTTRSTASALLSPEDVANRWSVKPSFILEQHRAGRLRATRVGKYVRFAEEDVAAFLESDHAKGITAPVRLIHSRKAAIPKG